MKLSAGTTVTVVSDTPDGFTVGRGSGARFKVSPAAIPSPLSGLVSAPDWTPGKALPYADSLVDLLVVDRDALAGGGLARGTENPIPRLGLRHPRQQA